MTLARINVAFAWVGTFVFGVFGALLALWLMGRNFSPSVEPPPAVQAMVSKLKASPPFAVLDTNPTACTHRRKGGGPANRCHYRAGDIEVMGIWRRRAPERASLKIARTTRLNDSSFAWADLTNTLPLLCDQIDRFRAADLADQLPAQISIVPWRNNRGDALASPIDGSKRSVRARDIGTCMIYLSEEVGSGWVRSIISARPNQ